MLTTSPSILQLMVMGLPILHLSMIPTRLDIVFADLLDEGEDFDNDSSEWIKPIDRVALLMIYIPLTCSQHPTWLPKISSSFVILRFVQFPYYEVCE